MVTIKNTTPEVINVIRKELIATLLKSSSPEGGLRNTSPRGSESEASCCDATIPSEDGGISFSAIFSFIFAAASDKAHRLHFSSFKSIQRGSKGSKTSLLTCVCFKGDEKHQR